MKNFFDFLKGVLRPSDKPSQMEITQVTLFVENIHTMKRFYTQVLGLAVLQDFETELLLGLAQGSVPLIRLLSVEKTSEQTTNLTYYLGFQIPKLQQLGALSNHFLLEDQPIVATSDDGYSEALYIMDPEQNLLKFYCEKKSIAAEKVNHEDQFMEGQRVTIPVEYFLHMTDLGLEALPAATRLNQVHLKVADCEQSVKTLEDLFGWRTTYDYVTGRKNFQLNDHPYSIAVNDWRYLDMNRTLVGVREILLVVRSIKVLEQLVTQLEERDYPYLYQGTELKVVTPDHVRYHFKVGERV